MIQPQELYDTLHRKPFQPFRVVLRDGRKYDVINEHIAAVGETYFAVGVVSPQEAKESWPICDYIDTLDLEDIIQVEPLPATSFAG